MPASQNANQTLEDQLEALRSVNSDTPAQRILMDIEQRVRRQQREFIAAVFGTGVAAIGLVIFALRGDWFAVLSLALATILMFLSARQSVRNAVSLTTLHSGESLLSAWRTELKRQLQHTLAAPLFAILFLGLTVGQVLRDGPLSPKTLAFLLVATGIGTFAMYQWLVLRPVLLRELKGLGADD